MEHARHFPTPMEMCMDDHLTQTTERTQQQHLQDKTALDNIQPPTRKCISTINVHSHDSHSSKSDRLKKSKVQGNRLTRLSHYINTGSPFDQKSHPEIFTNIGMTGKHYPSISKWTLT